MLRNLILWLAGQKKVTDAIARQGIRRGFARRFVAGQTLAEALAASAELCRNGRRISLNHLGENIASAAQATHSRDCYLRTLEALEQSGLDGNISIKLTQLGLDFDPALCAALTEDIAAGARSLGRTIEIDMEGSAYTTKTIEIFQSVQRCQGNAGLAIQACLRRSENDLQTLAPLKPKIRLVKGAYREPRQIAFQSKAQVDANYRKLLGYLLRPEEGFTTAIGTHDPLLIGYAAQIIAQRRLPQHRYEYQMLLGIRRDLQQKLFSEGHPLRVYVPWGDAWCPYFMRRLAERPANIWFVLQSIFAER